jgi:hypothetical protein
MPGCFYIWAFLFTLMLTQYHIDRVLIFCRKHKANANPYEVLEIVLQVINGVVFIDETITKELKSLINISK